VTASTRAAAPVAMVERSDFDKKLMRSLPDEPEMKVIAQFNPIILHDTSEVRARRKFLFANPLLRISRLRSKLCDETIIRRLVTFDWTGIATINR
jgi:hypothetical protein